MDKQDKEKFSKAAGEVAELVSDGNCTPKDALKKVASDNDFSRAMTENLARTYNLGVTWRQFKKGASLDQKLATVPLVHSDELANALYGTPEVDSNTEEKEASETFFPRTVPDYVQNTSEPEIHPVTKAAAEIKDEGGKIRLSERIDTLKQAKRHLEEVRARMGGLQQPWMDNMKKASALCEEVDKEFPEIHKRAVAAFGPDMDAYMSMIAEDNDWKKADMSKEAQRYFMVDTEEEPYKTLEKGAEYIEDITKLKEAESALEGTIKKAGEKLLDNVDKGDRKDIRAWLRESDSKKNIKEASELVNYMDFQKSAADPNAGGDADQFAEDMLNALQSQGLNIQNVPASQKTPSFPVKRVKNKKNKPKSPTTGKSKSKSKKSKTPSMQKKIDNQLSLLNKIYNRMEKQDKGDGKKKDDGTTAKSIAGTAPGAISGFFGGLLEAGTGMTEKMEEQLHFGGEEQGDSTGIMSPDFTSRLRNIKAKAHLNQFLSTDPVLSNMDSQEVINAFNKIRSIRPDILENKSLLRSLVIMATRRDDLGPELQRKLMKGNKGE